MTKQLTETSKFLSYILRHEPQAIGLILDNEGWANIDELIALANQSGKQLDRELIQQFVDTSDKKRFTISEDGLRIRAAQGHSTTSVAITYPEKTPPEFLYHGTATRFVESIRKEGLKPGDRHYVHLSEQVKTATEVGQRYGAPQVLIIAALMMHNAGFKFYLADNSVWLTESVPVRFIEGGLA